MLCEHPSCWCAVTQSSLRMRSDIPIWQYVVLARVLLKFVPSEKLSGLRSGIFCRLCHCRKVSISISAKVLAGWNAIGHCNVPIILSTPSPAAANWFLALHPCSSVLCKYPPLHFSRAGWHRVLSRKMCDRIAGRSNLYEYVSGLGHLTSAKSQYAVFTT